MDVISTSQWIAFFRKAGLPANVAANYAIIFSDNRIQLDMLLDISKEYLYDMGIKVMGDVIAILKYAKEFHNQLVKERMIGDTSTTSSNIAVAERMMGHYTRRISEPSLQNKKSLQKVANVISLKRKSSPETPTKRIRRVPPEEEGAYNIKMPSGTTEKTRKLLQIQQKKNQGQVIQLQKRSVFARLGDSAVSSSTDLNKVSSSVFERLGPSNKNSKIICDDMPSSTVVERPLLKGPPLPYKGVLKVSVGKERTVLKPSSLKKTFVRTVVRPVNVDKKSIIKTMKVNQINQIQNFLGGNRSLNIKRTVKASGGIFGDRVQKMSVKNRLGQKIDNRNIARSKILQKKSVPSKKSTVFERLG